MKHLGRDAAFSYYTVPQGADPTTWGYWPTGAMNRGSYGNGVIETTGYNARLQVSSIGDAKGSTTLFSKSYGYYDSAGANNGDILSIADTLSAIRNQTYSYDSLNRVISGAQADNAFDVAYHYDPWGNMTESGTSNFQPLFDGNNRMTPSGGCTPNLSPYCYDASGDLLKDNQGHVYIYDVEARIKTVDGAVASYTYGPDGNRVRKDANGASTEYIYFGGNAIAERNVTTGAWTDYIFGYGGKRIAKDTSLNGTAAQYYQDDHLGTTRIMTDAAGTVISDCTFNAFGEQISCSPDNAANHYRFTGKEHDNESGLDDFGARYYSSSMGRFATTDPVVITRDLSDPQTWNKYSYTFNRPTVLVDGDGKWPGWYHHIIIENNFSNLGQHSVRVLEDASDWVNSVAAGNQAPERSFMHAMRDGAHNQSVQEAERETNQYIASEMRTAVQAQADYEEHGGKAYSDDALTHFGHALHTVTDRTSPEHAGYQPWYCLVCRPGYKHRRDEENSATSSHNEDELARYIANVAASQLWYSFQSQLEAERKRRRKKHDIQSPLDGPSDNDQH